MNKGWEKYLFHVLCLPASRQGSMSRKYGFSFIEILIAIAVFGVLSSFLIVGFQDQNKSRELKNNALLILDGLKRTQTMALSGQKINSDTPVLYTFIISNCDSNCDYKILTDVEVDPYDTVQLNNNITVSIIGSAGVDNSISFSPPKASPRIFTESTEISESIIKVAYAEDDSIKSWCVRVSSVSGRMDLTQDCPESVGGGGGDELPDGNDPPPVGGSCPGVSGCMDILAQNYNVTAVCDCADIEAGSNNSCCIYCGDGFCNLDYEECDGIYPCGADCCEQDPCTVECGDDGSCSNITGGPEEQCATAGPCEGENSCGYCEVCIDMMEYLGASWHSQDWWDIDQISLCLIDTERVVDGVRVCEVQSCGPCGVATQSPEEWVEYGACRLLDDCDPCLTGNACDDTLCTECRCVEADPADCVSQTGGYKYSCEWNGCNYCSAYPTLCSGECEICIDDGGNYHCEINPTCLDPCSECDPICDDCDGGVCVPNDSCK